MVKILAALSILNSSCASPGSTKKVVELVARATCSGASHSCGYCINSRKLQSAPHSKNLEVIFYIFTVFEEALDNKEVMHN